MNNLRKIMKNLSLQDMNNICYTIHVVGFGGLGFYRSVNYYNYWDKKLEPDYQRLYTRDVFNGFLGSCLYVFPPTLLLFIIPKELYRLEVNIRNLKVDKNSREYLSFF